MIKGYHGLIMKRYEELREQERSALLKRKMEVEAKAPELLELEKRIAKLSMDLAVLNFKKNVNHQEEFPKLKNAIVDLRGKRLEILTRLGYPLNYLDHQYACSKCQDTGYIRQEKCTWCA